MTSAEAQSIELPHPSRIWPLALPVLAENTLLMGVNWSDTFLAGRILQQDAYLAAMTAVAYLLWLFKTTADLVALGAFAVVAREIGAHHVAGARRVTYQAVLLGALLGIVIGILVHSRAFDIVGLLVSEGKPREYAAEYLRVFAWAVPFDITMIVAVNCMRAAGYTYAGMVVGALVNATNIALCWILATGSLGAPKLGWMGLAYGTTFAFILGCLFVLAWLKRGVGVLTFPNQFSLPNLVTVARILRVGIPGGAATMSLVCCHLGFVRLVSGLGESTVAAHGIAIQVESLSYLIGDAFAAATAALVGQSLGANRPDLARSCGLAGIVRGAGLMGIIGIIFVCFGPTICSLYTVSPEIGRQAGEVVRLMGFAEAPMGAAIVLGGVFRGSGDTKTLFAITFAGMLGIRMPLAALFVSPAFAWGLWGAWLAMLIDVIIRTMAASIRFAGKGWMRQRV